MSPRNVLLCLIGLTLALVEAQVSVHSSMVSVTSHPSDPVHVNPLTHVPKSTTTPLTLSWSHTLIPAPSAGAAADSGSRRASILGGVLGSLAVVVAAVGGFIIFSRIRRNSTRHWRNRSTGRWQDLEGKPGGAVYVGQPVERRPFGAYGEDTKAPGASPTTPNFAPLFIREPRIAPSSGHRPGSSSLDASSTYIEMEGNLSSPTRHK